MIKPVSTPKAPGAIGPYSQGTVTSGLVFVSGQLPANPETGELLTDIPAAAKQALTNLKSILEAAGSNMESVAKVTIFLADMSSFAQVNEVYATFFKEPYPARSCFAVKELPKGAVLEIEAIAAAK